ncbi:MAG: hypothetical protein ACRAVC_07085 [Trichormus sp.]
MSKLNKKQHRGRGQGDKGDKGDNYFLFPMPNAQCPMPHAPSPR